MTTGVLTSDTVPVNWTIEGAGDNALRQSLYVQLQAAYNAIDELGYHQAASLLTAQLTDEVNALSKKFASGEWTADSNQDAFDVSKALLISGLQTEDVAPTAAAFITTSVPGGQVGAGVSYHDLPAISYATGASFDSAIQSLMNDSEFFGELVQMRNILTGEHYGTFLIGPQGGGYFKLSPPFPDATVIEVAADNSITVPDSALPGDILKTDTDPPTYYIIDVSRSANKIGDAYLPIRRSADSARLDIWDQKLSQAINELTRNGQIEAARLQQLVNLLQNLLAGASNTEAKETRVKESILSKL